MFKRFMKGLVIGGAVLAMTGATVQADTIEVNLFGASAQYKFWTKAAGNFLVNELECAQSDVYIAYTEDVTGGSATRDTGIAVCVGSDSVTTSNTTYPASQGAASLNGETVIIRYTTNASYDGIWAVTDDADPDRDTDSCPTTGDRLQADLATATLEGYTSGSTGTVTALTCQDVNIGASDVAATTFAQASSGYLDGPTSSSTDIETRSIKYANGDLQDPVSLGYDYYNPIVVPFSFFAHDDGNSQVPFDNLTREMAVALFSGVVADWNEFDPSASSQGVVLCMRHAGSGTAATLNAAVMRNDGGVVETQVLSTSYAYLNGWSPAIYFNSGSSALMKCVSSLEGAIGYADSNKCFSDDPEVNNHVDAVAAEYEDAPGYSSDDSKCGYAKRLKYQGVNASAITISNGQYPFWSAQWLFSNEDENSGAYAVIEALNDFASDPDNIDGMGTKYSYFWEAQDAMNWFKDGDFALPVKAN